MARRTNSRQPDSPAMRLTRYSSVGQRVRAEWWHQEGTAWRAEFERRWPDMAAAIGALVDLVDEDYPANPIPTTPLWTHPHIDHSRAVSPPAEGGDPAA